MFLVSRFALFLFHHKGQLLREVTGPLPWGSPFMGARCPAGSTQPHPLCSWLPDMRGLFPTSALLARWWLLSWTEQNPRGWLKAGEKLLKCPLWPYFVQTEAPQTFRLKQKHQKSVQSGFDVSVQGVIMWNTMTSNFQKQPPQDCQLACLSRRAQVSRSC